MRLSLCIVPYFDPKVPPLAPALLKGIIETENHSVTTYDINVDLFDNVKYNSILNWLRYDAQELTFKEFLWYQKYVRTWAKKLIKDVDAVGISVFSIHSLRFTEDLCFWIRKLNSDIKIILGGNGSDLKIAPFTVKWKDIMINSNLVDCVILNEGEHILDVLDGNLETTIDTPQLSNDELNSLPVPNFDDYDLSVYKNKNIWGKTFLPITGSKGCIRKCSFCDVPRIWNKFSFRSGESIAKEMIQLNEKYDVDNFYFTDSLINYSTSNLREMNTILAHEVPNKLNYYGQYIFKAAHQTLQEDYELMRIGGCKSVNIGIESGSESVRNHMKKHFSNSDVISNGTLLHNNNIRQEWNLMVGYPTETDQDFKETLDLCSEFDFVDRELFEIKPVSPVLMLPNTPLSDDALGEFNFKTDAINGYEYEFWTTEVNPTNTFDKRCERYFMLCDHLEKLNFTQDHTYVKRKKEVISALLEIYNERSS